MCIRDRSCIIILRNHPSVNYIMIALAEEKAPRKSLWQRHRAFLSGIVALIIIGTFLLTSGFHPAPPHEAKRPHHGKGPKHSPKCEKIEALSPSFKHSVDTILHDPAFRNGSIEKLSNAVRIPTVVQDKNPNPADCLLYTSRCV